MRLFLFGIEVGDHEGTSYGSWSVFTAQLPCTKDTVLAPLQSGRCGDLYRT